MGRPGDPRARTNRPECARARRRAVVSCGTRPKRSDARIVATDTPDRSASSGRDMPAARTHKRQRRERPLGRAEAVMDKPGNRLSRVWPARVNSVSRKTGRSRLARRSAFLSSATKRSVTAAMASASTGARCRPRLAGTRPPSQPPEPRRTKKIGCSRSSTPPRPCGRRPCDLFATVAGVLDVDGRAFDRFGAPESARAVLLLDSRRSRDAGGAAARTCRAAVGQVDRRKRARFSGGRLWLRCASRALTITKPTPEAMFAAPSTARLR